IAAGLLLGAAIYADQARQSAARAAHPGGVAAAAGSADAQKSQPAMPSGGAGNQSQNASAGRDGAAAGANAQAAFPAPAKEVTIDFLYADWCPYCQGMKPIVARLEAAMPAGRFEVRYWNYEGRGNATTAAVYAEYGSRGYFAGSVPTFVANGNDSKVGSISESDLRSWACSKFSLPKPQGC
ncbi:MAG: thioredoxin family protein, partial [Candidatus Micrarchaeia archaeon]